MATFLSVYGVVFGVALVVAMLMMAQKDESTSHKWAKVWVRNDDKDRRRLPEQRDEDEYEAKPGLEWLILGGILLLTVLLLGNV